MPFEDIRDVRKSSLAVVESPRLTTITLLFLYHQHTLYYILADTCMLINIAMAEGYKHQ